jgi:hypothetical protein
MDLNNIKYKLFQKIGENEYMAVRVPMPSDNVKEYKKQHYLKNIEKYKQRNREYRQRQLDKKK